MWVALKVLQTISLLIFMAFCRFGFLSRFEPPDFLVARLVYGALILALAYGIGAL